MRDYKIAPTGDLAAPRNTRRREPDTLRTHFDGRIRAHQGNTKTVAQSERVALTGMPPAQRGPVATGPRGGRALRSPPSGRADRVFPRRRRHPRPLTPRGAYLQRSVALGPAGRNPAILSNYCEVSRPQLRARGHNAYTGEMPREPAPPVLRVPAVTPVSPEFRGNKRIVKSGTGLVSRRCRQGGSSWTSCAIC